MHTYAISYRPTFQRQTQSRGLSATAKLLVHCGAVKTQHNTLEPRYSDRLQYPLAEEEVHATLAVDRTHGL